MSCLQRHTAPTPSTPVSWESCQVPWAPQAGRGRSLIPLPGLGGPLPRSSRCSDTPWATMLHWFGPPPSQISKLARRGSRLPGSASGRPPVLPLSVCWAGNIPDACRRGHICLRWAHPRPGRAGPCPCGWPFTCRGHVSVVCTCVGAAPLCHSAPWLSLSGTQCRHPTPIPRPDDVPPPPELPSTPMTATLDLTS